MASIWQSATVAIVRPFRALGCVRIMPADTHIPVTAETREELRALKQPGQTYDDLLRALTQQQRRQELQRRLRKLEDADSGELTRLSDA